MRVEYGYLQLRESRLDHNGRAFLNEIEQFDHIRIAHPHAATAGGRADFVLVLGAMDVNEPVMCIGIPLVQSVEP